MPDHEAEASAVTAEADDQNSSSGAVKLARYHRLRHWQLGVIRMSIARLGESIVAVEDLPESVEDTPTAADWSSDSDSVRGFAPLVRKTDTLSVYGPMPGTRRLIDLVIDLEAHRTTLDGAVAESARLLADTHRMQAACSRHPTPPAMARHVRYILREPAFQGIVSRLRADPRLRFAAQILTSHFWPTVPHNSVVVGGFAPSAIFVGDNGPTRIAVTRWTGHGSGDPLYDVGSFVGPLLEIALNPEASPTTQQRSIGLARGFIAEYENRNGITIQRSQSSPLWRFVILNILQHYIYHIKYALQEMPDGYYVDSVGELAATGHHMLAARAGNELR